MTQAFVFDGLVMWPAASAELFLHASDWMEQSAVASDPTQKTEVTCMRVELTMTGRELRHEQRQTIHDNEHDLKANHALVLKKR